MPTYTKGLDLYNAQKALFDRSLMTAKQGHQAIAEAAGKDLLELLSGSLTPAQTRGAFARGSSPATSTPTGRRRQLTARQRKARGLAGAVPLNPINVQSGDLLRGVELRRAQAAAAQAFDLGIEDVAYARYVLAIGGTSKMVGRGVQAELKRRFGPRNKAFFDHFRDASRP